MREEEIFAAISRVLRTWRRFTPTQWPLQFAPLNTNDAFSYDARVREKEIAGGHFSIASTRITSPRRQDYSAIRPLISEHSFVSEQSRRIVRLIDISDDIDDIRRKATM